MDEFPAKLYSVKAKRISSHFEPINTLFILIDKKGWNE